MDPNRLPKHIAIIMDGNGRWAQAHHLPRTQGHIEGVKRVDEIIRAARKLGIGAITLYTFSTENWLRPEGEVSMLMKIFMTVLSQKIKLLQQLETKVQFIGRRQGIPEEVLNGMDEAAHATENNRKMVLNIAFNYGGRQELLDVFQQLAGRIERHEMKVDQINEKAVSDLLYTRGLPDPDLLIRTSGEKRISNFLLWQLSYAEFYFTEKCWPEFNEEEFIKAIEDYQSRERKFGGVSQASAQS